jgi:hypothetical protein
LLDETGPHWWELPTVGPLLMLAPSIFTLAAIPVAKLLLVRRFAPGDYPLFGWLYVRWVLLETLLGRVEENTTSRFNGTLFARIFYESMGARWAIPPPDGLAHWQAVRLKPWLRRFSECQSKIFAHHQRHTLIFQRPQVRPGRPCDLPSLKPAQRCRRPVVGDASPMPRVRPLASLRHYVNLREIRRRRQLPQNVFEYFAGGAADEIAQPRSYADPLRSFSRCNGLRLWRRRRTSR